MSAAETAVGDGRFIVVGAGGIGGVIGARLSSAGYEVALVARGAHAKTMARDGLTLIAPDERTTFRLPVFERLDHVDFRPGDVALLTAKSQHTRGLLHELALVAGVDIPVVCLQNGVANEREALRRFLHVYASLVILPAVHLEPGQVVTHAEGLGGVLDTGRYPAGVDPMAEYIVAAFSAAGFSAEADDGVMRKKYAKLVMNVGNALEAATDRAPGSGEVARMLRAEATDAYRANGIDWTSRDDMAARMQGVYTMVDIPGIPRSGGSSWQSIARGTGDIEADYLNGEIVLLGRLAGVPTPANAVCQTLAREMASRRLPVGSFSVDEVMARIEASVR